MPWDEDNKDYFVDKSLLIRETIKGNMVVHFPRPHRFGKILNMTMLRYFFEQSDEDLEIAKYPECMKYRGQYPVIFITLKQFKGTNYPETELQPRKIVSELYSLNAGAAKILDTDISISDFKELNDGKSPQTNKKQQLEAER